MATQQAIYCYLYGYDLKDFEAIGEAGERTLNALKEIVRNAKVSTEKRPENTVTIEEIQEDFEIDTLDSNYISKTYQVTSESFILRYTAFFVDNENKEYKITDENNVEKVAFESNEKFKVLIPKKFINQEIKFKLCSSAEIYSKAIIEGVPDNPLYQKYAMTATAEETVTIIKEDEYPKIKEETKPVVKEEPKQQTKKLPVTGK